MRFLFHGLDDVEAHIEQMKGDLSHLAIHRRAKSKAFEERLGRYDFTLDDARRALSLPDRYGLCSDLHDAADEAIDDGDLDALPQRHRREGRALPHPRLSPQRHGHPDQRHGLRHRHEHRRV